MTRDCGGTHTTTEVLSCTMIAKYTNVKRKLKPHEYGVQRQGSAAVARVAQVIIQEGPSESDMIITGMKTTLSTHGHNHA